MQPAHFEIPRLSTLARHALPNVVESTLIPLVIFMVTLRVLGVWGALAGGLVWSYGALLRRVVTGRRVPGILLLGSVTLTARTAIALATGSVFVYFLQPTLGTVLVATAFLVSVPIGRPLAQRLANDFCPIPPHVLANEHVRRFFLRISLLWAFTQLANATVTIWLLVSQSVGTFVVAKTVVSAALTTSAIAVSTVWFKRSMTRHGILVGRPVTVAAG
ncbi:MAG: hypothetical protein M5U14_12535 [Acidimicrobiia bacterium]|nr:hypothetical protein [Acidimicrobiia bacterium]